ncbi:hypothetical protein [Paraliomyxa miuraensis]|uniref:hypothetical protein n=1 Tax=Paraliomyxa miuraensis TaxID=376150 RepID=UPI00225B8160|nr:hypothetical protein [Paraliomyxa miuraensis]MCX4241824.1 hypothetical protein [Paraliomyxa miuraensis]
MQIKATSSSTLLVLSLMIGVGACDDQAPSPDELVLDDEDATISMHSVDSALATKSSQPLSVDDFCERLSDAYLQASQGCDPEEVGAQTLACPLDLEHPLLISGELTFDPEGAAAYLVASVAEATACTGALPVEPLFLRGSRGEGEDCTPVDGDLTYAKTCAPGLRCLGDAQGIATCRQPHEDLVTDMQDCEHGNCVPIGGARVNLSNPDELCIKARDASGAGTDGTLTLKFYYEGDLEKCSFTGIDRGETKCCTPSDAGSAGSSAFYMHVKTDSSNAVRVAQVGVVKNGTYYYTSQFDNDDLGLYLQCEGCDLFFNGCNSCWVDKNGHGSCQEASFHMDDGTAFCPI